MADAERDQPAVREEPRDAVGQHLRQAHLAVVAAHDVGVPGIADEQRLQQDRGHGGMPQVAVAATLVAADLDALVAADRHLELTADRLGVPATPVAAGLRGVRAGDHHGIARRRRRAAVEMMLDVRLGPVGVGAPLALAVVALVETRLVHCCLLRSEVCRPTMLRAARRFAAAATTAPADQDAEDARRDVQRSSVNLASNAGCSM